MALAYVGTPTTGTVSAGTTISVAKPTGVAVGNLLLIYYGGGANAITTGPTGFTLQASSTNAGTRLYSRIADGTEASTFSATYGSSQHGGAICVAISGQAATWQDPTTFPACYDPGVFSQTSAPIPSITLAGSTDWVLCFYGAAFNTASPTLTKPTATTSRVAQFSSGVASSDATLAMADIQSIGSGATGTQTFTSSTGNDLFGYLIGIIPAAGGTPGTVTGITATATAAAPAGSVQAGAKITGITAAATAAAPAGTVTGSGGTPGTVTGVTAAATSAAPAGSVSAGAVVAGVTATSTAAAPPGAVGAGVTISAINTWTDADINNYGLRVIPVANTPGNAMVAYVAWNAANGINPISNVSDDAHNNWVPLVTSSANGNVRCAIWIAPNTRKGVGTNGGSSTVSVSLSQWTGGISATVTELVNFPAFVQLDGPPVSGFNNSTTTQSLSAVAATSDLALGMAVTGNINQTLTPPGTMFPLSSVPAIQTQGSGTTIHGPAWKQLTPGSYTETWTVPAAAPMASAMALLSLSPSAPAQPNPNWPTIQVQAAFGYNPGDPTQMPVWTDISARAQDVDGSTVLQAARGRAYELATPEAGTITLSLDNHDGAFTPGNPASPYYPNVMLQTPVRILATWAGVTYPVGYGYVSGWPQEWPEPHWGFAPVAAVDAMGVLASINMYSCYQSEVLIDQPFAYFPLNEYYQGANGLPFNNLAFGNNRPAIGMDDVVNNVPLATGIALNMFGDSGTGSGITGLAANAFALAGLVYDDPGLPQVNAGGYALECWATVSPTAAGSANTPASALLSLYGEPANYWVGGFAAGPVFWSEIVADSHGAKTGTLQYGFADATGKTTFRTVSTKVAVDGNAHHHFVNITGTSNYTANYYFDGQLIDTWSPSAATVAVSSDVRYLVMGPPNLFGDSPGLGGPDYILGHVAVYPRAPLDAARILKHFNSGLSGAFGDSGMRRFTKIMAWGRAGVPKAAGTASQYPTMGYADAYAGLAIMDALGTVTAAEGCNAYADGFGVVTYLSRSSTYNRTPKYTFDENGAAGTTFYEPGMGFGYDVTYLYNLVQAERQISQNQGVLTGPGNAGVQPLTFKQYGASAQISDTTSELEYLPRNALTGTLETTSDQDVYDWANWYLTKYKQPAFRVKTITLNPAANPAVWPVALGVEQGDVVQVNRRPIGGPAYSVLGVVQKIEHSSGPSNWTVKLTISPYTIEANVLQLGVAGYNSVTNNRIAW